MKTFKRILGYSLATILLIGMLVLWFLGPMEGNIRMAGFFMLFYIIAAFIVYGLIELIDYLIR